MSACPQMPLLGGHDESDAIKELKKLSDNAKMFLAHQIKNSLMVIMFAVANGNKQAASDELWALKHKLNGWGF